MFSNDPHAMQLGPDMECQKNIHMDVLFVALSNNLVTIGSVWWHQAIIWTNDDQSSVRHLPDGNFTGDAQGVYWSTSTLQVLHYKC